MKPFARHFSMIAALCLLAAPGLVRAATTCAAPASGPPLPPDMVATARQGGPYPSFCSIPRVPTDVPSAATFKSRVVDVRLDGRQLERRTEAQTFSLGDTDRFAADVRRQAAPPPPMTTPDEGDTAAFVAAMKAKATPPKRVH